jgi:two-component system, cell cycle response regulator CpdR
MGKILIAEDETSVQAFVDRALRHCGHQTVIVGDGLAALAALRGETFDLLLTDIVMPGLDGIALALKASKDYPKMRILLMTGFAHERQRAHNLEALIHRVIAKPFTLEEICTVVEEELSA